MLFMTNISRCHIKFDVHATTVETVIKWTVRIETKKGDDLNLNMKPVLKGGMLAKTCHHYSIEKWKLTSFQKSFQDQEKELRQKFVDEERKLAEKERELEKARMELEKNQLEKEKEQMKMVRIFSQLHSLILHAGVFRN